MTQTRELTEGIRSEREVAAEAAMRLLDVGLIRPGPLAERIREIADAIGVPVRDLQAAHSRQRAGGYRPPRVIGVKVTAPPATVEPPAARNGNGAAPAPPADPPRRGPGRPPAPPDPEPTRISRNCPKCKVPLAVGELGQVFCPDCNWKDKRTGPNRGGRTQTHPEAPKPGTGMRRCTLHDDGRGANLPEDRFRIKNKRTGTRRSMCLDCETTYQRQRYLTNSKTQALEAIRIEFVVADGQDVVGLQCTGCGKKIVAGQLVHADQIAAHVDCKDPFGDPAENPS